MVSTICEVFAQALRQTAAPSFSQNCGGQIGTRDGPMVRCCRDGPDHQRTCRFQALEAATLAAAQWNGSELVCAVEETAALGSGSIRGLSKAPA